MRRGREVEGNRGLEAAARLRLAGKAGSPVAERCSSEAIGERIGATS